MIVTPLFKKLNFKQHKEILIVNHPAEFEAEIYQDNEPKYRLCND